MSDTSSQPTSDQRLGERLAYEHEVELAGEVERLRAEVDRLRAELRRVAYGHASNANSIRKQQRAIEGLRIDRQIRALPTFLARRVRRRPATSAGGAADQDDSAGDHARLDWLDHSPSRQLVVLAHAYPVDHRSYGGQPLARRLRHYVASGHDVTVLLPARQSPGFDLVDELGVRVVSAPVAELGRWVDRSDGPILIHSPTPELWQAASRWSDIRPIIAWFHGFECRSWRDLSFDFRADEIVQRAAALDDVDTARRQTLREIFEADSVHKVFVSDYLRWVAERFAGVPARSAEIIHNVIDPAEFPRLAKLPDAARHVLMIRNFDKRNYGTDLATMALLELARRPTFSEIRVRIVGDGRHFDEDLKPLRGFPNVEVERGFVDPDGIRSLLGWGGTLLLPTRWDSQGMMMGEGMMAGLVPVVNGVTAIPEFVDEQCAALAGADDHVGLADGIESLVADGDRFLSMSEAAHDRVLSQCGPAVTIRRELQLIARAN